MKTYTLEQAKQKTGLFHSIGDGSCAPCLEEYFLFIPAHPSSGLENVGLYLGYCSLELEVLEEEIWKDDLFVESKETLNITFSNENQKD